MAISDHTKIFDSLEIRDVVNHNSDSSELYNFLYKTFFIENSLDQPVTLQFQSSAHEDFSDPVNLGEPFEVAANTVDYQTCECYFPRIRVQAICSSTPTSGDLTIHLFSYQGD